MRRPGYMLMELALAVVLMAALVGASLKMLSAIAMQRRAAEYRALALVEAANLLERAQGVPWSELSTEGLAGQKMDETARQLLPGGSAVVEVEPAAVGPAAKRIRVEVRWQPAASRPEASVVLCHWVYAKTEARP